MNPIEKTVLSLDWMTIVLFVSLVVLALGKYLYHGKFLRFEECDERSDQDKSMQMGRQEALGCGL